MGRTTPVVHALLWLGAAALWTGCGAQAAPVGEEWPMYEELEAAGWSAEGLEAARAVADSVGSTAVLLVHEGRVVVAWGDVDRPIRTYSVRKSLVSLLYGEPVAAGEIDLDRAVSSYAFPGDLELTEQEGSARVRHLLSARSGIYLPAALETEGARERRPERGSHAPGTHWYYNNFDFNAAGWILEEETGRDMFTLFEERIAEPIGMQDYDPEEGFYRLEPRTSPIPAYDFMLSARDLARVGALVEHHGQWGAEQVVPTEWLEASTESITEFERGTGYGYMWWVDPHRSLAPNVETPALDAVSSIGANGANGQQLLVIPELQTVLVHQGDTYNEGAVSDPDVFRVLEALLAARTGPAADNATFAPLTAKPFDYTVEPEPAPPAIELPVDTLRAYTGRYAAGPMTIEIFLYDGRLFASGGPSEEGLVPTAMDQFRSPVIPLRIHFQRNEDGAVTGATVQTPEGRTVEARRLPDDGG